MYLPSSAGTKTSPPSSPAILAYLRPRSLHFYGNKPAGGGGDGGRYRKTDWSSLIGIITAIVGNVLIALAINVQRFAHIRLHQEKVRARERARLALRRARNTNEDDSGQEICGATGGMRNENAVGCGIAFHDNQEEDEHEDDPLAYAASASDDGAGWSEDDSENRAADAQGKEAPSTYLKDLYWWLGQLLITVGEMGNFLAYGFAPASIVSLLGVVALVSNCVIAPLFFKEKPRPRDLWGVIIAVGGAVTVVSSAPQTEIKLAPHDVWDAITTVEFEIYVGVSCALIVLLMWLSPRYGNRTILIDLGLVGLFGGYTALSTKGVSSLLSSTLLGAFTTPISYALLLVLLVTAVMQVRYVNKALQRFDSTQVIPVQFVLFTLSVIIGSAVLYRDFERTTVQQAIKFICGCALTFFGVFFITSGRPHKPDEDEEYSVVEGVDETIGLANQEPSEVRPSPRKPSRRGSEPASSRGALKGKIELFTARTPSF